jgi:hypothetical protein
LQALRRSRNQSDEEFDVEGRHACKQGLTWISAGLPAWNVFATLQTRLAT